ncbi:unnamed protein product [Mytilus coruscus]|uniref:VWFD domain-containing protein n=1 Tax=Mytilus coruscus TaxID=42192 RepID=A0A6J8BTG5_MYTCO|nr:unnamed protein product [Mytilus coruscus]
MEDFNLDIAFRESDNDQTLIEITICPNLLVADSNRIYLINLNDSSVTKLVVDTQGGMYRPELDYHHGQSYIYWVDSYYGTIHRTCYPCYDNERKIEVIIPKSSNYHAHSVAIDSDNDHIYWSDRDYNAVFRSELDGSNELVIINSSAKIGHIALDVKNNWIYFMDNEIGSIDRCTLHGKDKTTIISDSVMTTGSRILLDFEVNRIYWTAQHLIRSATFDGSNLKEVQSYGYTLYQRSYYNLFGIAVQGDYLYFTENWNNRYVKKVEKTGTSYGYVAYVHNTIIDLKMYHGSRTFPKFVDGNMTIEACMQTNQSVCEESVYIVIRNCDGYNVYYLRPTPANSSYCFGSGPVHCPDSMSSETEYYPGCSSNFPTDSAPVEVKALLTEGEIFPISNLDPTPSLIPIFKCVFEDQSNGTYAYDVYWLICGNVIKNKNNLLFKDIADAIVLKEMDWHGNYKMNMEVKCAIRMRNSKESTPGQYLYSPVFHAGLLGNLDWMEKRTLQVYGYNDGLYNVNNRYAYIKLSTSSVSTPNNIWKDVYIRQIRVTVVDKDSVLKNRLCQSYNDPHFRTFDGKYYDYMGVGEFVMYKNDIGPYRVHALFTSCGSGLPGTSCLCGIAIRSKDLLFVLRTCEKISRSETYFLKQPVITLTSCDKNNMSIINTNNNYKIVLPIVTEIQFSIARRFISVISIKPSVKDINTAKGLCGVPSTTKDPSDDFTHRENGPINDGQIFADSWRISSEMVDEQLFVEEPEFLKQINDAYNSIFIVVNNKNNPNLATCCTCEQQASSNDSLDDFNSVNCNLTDSSEQCLDSSSSYGSYVQYESCLPPLRRRRSVNFPHEISKRSLSYDDDVVDFQPLIYSDDVNETETEPPATFRNGWTSDRAYNICFNSINDALQNDMYKDYVDVPVKKFIESCVKDIEVAGDTTFLTDTINTMVTSIMTELVKTESLYTQKSSDGSQTMLEYFASALCLNNCSDNGICKSGKDILLMKENNKESII